MFDAVNFLRVGKGDKTSTSDMLGLGAEVQIEGMRKAKERPCFLHYLAAASYSLIGDILSLARQMITTK